MKNWKRNAVIATVVVFICAGVYLNWSYNGGVTDLTQTISTDQLMNDGTLVMAQSEAAVEPSGGEMADYFAQVRLSRQESRDTAVELLEQTIAYDEGTEIGTSASGMLNELVSTALSEAQIESLVIAKGYEDCVTYINDGTVCVAVSAPAQGLNEQDIALISDVVTAQTSYTLPQVRIVEVKS